MPKENVPECYIAVPLGADENRLRDIFASMAKYPGYKQPAVGRSWLMREQAGNVNSPIVGKAHAILVPLTKNHKEIIRETGAIIQAEIPTGTPKLPEGKPCVRTHFKPAAATQSAPLTIELPAELASVTPLAHETSMPSTVHAL